MLRLKLNERHAISAVKFEFRLGVKENAFCVQNMNEMCFWNRRHAVPLGEERRGEGEGTEGGGGNCHIKGKEFKINLISLSLSPPKRLTVSMLHLVVRHKESTERVKWRREERGRGSDRGNRLAPNQVELVWEGSRQKKKKKKKGETLYAKAA